jgi:hypothetical protein
MANLLVLFLLAFPITSPSFAQEWQDGASHNSNAFWNDLNDVVNTTSPFLQYELPPVEITLQVTKRDGALMEFQDLLDDAIQMHLEDFYQEKLEEKVFHMATKVRFNVESKLIWRELSIDDATATAAKHYEISGRYLSIMAFNYDALADNSTVYVSQSLMNLFFIEAFQGIYYWDL